MKPKTQNRGAGSGGTPVPLRELRKNLRMLEREVQLAMASDTGCCGVSLAQCHILLEVEMRGCTSVTDLSSAFGLDKSTLSRAVDGMCREGWLDRVVDEGNRRQQVITLTKAGRDKALSINGACDASYGRIFDCIPPSRWKSVVESVELLAAAMCGMRKSGGCACAGLPESARDVARPAGSRTCTGTRPAGARSTMQPRVPAAAVKAGRGIFNGK